MAGLEGTYCNLPCAGSRTSLPVLSCGSEGLRVYFQEGLLVLETALEGEQGQRKIG